MPENKDDTFLECEIEIRERRDFKGKENKVNKDKEYALKT